MYRHQSQCINSSCSCLGFIALINITIFCVEMKSIDKEMKAIIRLRDKAYLSLPQQMDSGQINLIQTSKADDCLHEFS